MIQTGTETERGAKEKKWKRRAAETKGNLEGLVKRQTKQRDSVRGSKMANRDGGGR